MDKTNACIQRVGRSKELNDFSIDHYLSLVWLMNPTQDVHQGGLAGTIFSNQGTNFPTLDVEVDVFENIVGTKGFIDV